MSGTTWARRVAVVAALTAVFAPMATNMVPAHAATVSGSKGTTAFATPNLAAGFTPQGMTATPSGKLMLAEYKAGSNTRLVDVTTAGKIYGQVAIAETHAGGIAIVGQWLYVQDAATTGSDTVRRYRLADINSALTKSHKAKGHPVYVKAAGTQKLASWQFASVMTSDGAQLLAGHHGVGDGARLYRFNVDQATGALTAVGHATIPENAQGIAAAGNVVTAGGGHLVVNGVARSIPSHAEGVVVVGKTAYIAFEDGAKSVLKFNL